MDPNNSIPNILIITKSLDLGGTESHIRSLANGLSEMGVPIIVASQPGRQCDLLNSSVPFEPIRFQTYLLISNLLRVFKLIRLHNINIIHAHSRRAITFGAIASLLFGIPLVVTVHGRVKYDLRSRFARYKAIHIILVNKNTYREVQNWPIFRKKLTAIPNGSDLTNLPSLDPDINTSFVYASRIDRKHFHVLELLVRTFASEEIKGKAVLQIVGDGDFAPKLLKIISDSGAINISYTGYQSDPAIFLKNSHVIIGVGKVAVDGLCAGKAVFTLNGAHMGQMVTQDNFESLLDSNFVNISGLPPSASLVTADIKEIINKAQQNLLPTKSQIGLERIESLSLRNQVISTLAVYRVATEH